MFIHDARATGPSEATRRPPPNLAKTSSNSSTSGSSNLLCVAGGGRDSPLFFPDIPRDPNSIEVCIACQYTVCTYGRIVVMGGYAVSHNVVLRYIACMIAPLLYAVECLLGFTHLIYHHCGLLDVCSGAPNCSRSTLCDLVMCPAYTLPYTVHPAIHQTHSSSASCCSFPLTRCGTSWILATPPTLVAGTSGERGMKVMKHSISSKRNDHPPNQTKPKYPILCMVVSRRFVVARTGYDDHGGNGCPGTKYIRSVTSTRLSRPRLSRFS